MHATWRGSLKSNLGTALFLISASCVAGMTGVGCTHQLLVKMGLRITGVSHQGLALLDMLQLL
jgi:hypothetical protein